MGLTACIVYGIGLLRPYEYFYRPETCHNAALRSWIYSRGEQRFVPEQYVRVLLYAANDEEMNKLEAIALNNGPDNLLNKTVPRLRRGFL